MMIKQFRKHFQNISHNILAPPRHFSPTTSHGSMVGENDVATNKGLIFLGRPDTHHIFETLLPRLYNRAAQLADSYTLTPSERDVIPDRKTWEKITLILADIVAEVTGTMPLPEAQSRARKLDLFGSLLDMSALKSVGADVRSLANYDVEPPTHCVTVTFADENIARRAHKLLDSMVKAFLPVVEGEDIATKIIRERDAARSIHQDKTDAKIVRFEVGKLETYLPGLAFRRFNDALATPEVNTLMQNAMTPRTAQPIYTTGPQIGG